MTAKDVFGLARNRDQAAIRLVKQTADYLGMGIAATINTLAPELVVIGGGVSKAGRDLFDPLRESVKRRVMAVHRPFVRVVRAKRGDSSVLFGAAAMALRL
jgi:glucokinase